MDDIWKDWVIDVTHESQPPVFMPYDNGSIVWGMNVMSDKCPGNLVALVHEGGQEMAEEYVKQNPNWREKYG